MALKPISLGFVAWNVGKGYAAPEMWNRLRKHTLALIGALLLTYIFVTSLPLNDYERATFSGMIEGRAYRPYVYRVLYPSLLRITSQSLSPNLEASLSAVGDRNSWIKEIATKNRLKAHETPELVLFLGLCLLSFYGFLLVLRALIPLFYPQISEAGMDGWMLFASLPAGLSASVYFYIYDVGLWLLFPLALLFLLRRQWPQFFLAYFICTLNKETSLLLIPILYFWIKEEKPKTQIFLLSLTFVIWIVAFSCIRYTYRFNPGGFLEFHLIDQWKSPLLAAWLPPFLTTVLLFTALSAYRWKEKSLILRQGLLWTFLPMFMLMLVFGFAYETRDYYESFVFAYLLSIPTVQAIIMRFHRGNLATWDASSTPG